MSGGSLEYIYARLEDAICEIRDRAQTPLQKAFANHLVPIVEALHNLEWVFSGDWSEGSEEEAIKKVLGENYRSKSIEVVKDELEKMILDFKNIVTEKNDNT